MKKLLGIVVLSFMCSNLGFAYEKYKPLSKINLKLWGSIEDLYQSIPNINKAECEIRFYYNGSYMRETLNSTISESDFFLVANFKNKEANIYCDKLFYDIEDIQGKSISHEYTLALDVCGGRIYSWHVTFGLAHDELTLLQKPGFGENPNILKEWIKAFQYYSDKEPEIKKQRSESKDYKDIDGKFHNTFANVRSWKDLIKENGKNKFQVFLTSYIGGNDALGPHTHRISYAVHDRTMNRMYKCNS